MFDGITTDEIGAPVGSFRAVLADVRAWLTAPFVGKVDLLHLFLLVGLVITFSIAWSMILAHVRMAAEEIV